MDDPNVQRLMEEGFPDTPWTQLDKLITDYVDEYYLADAEDADGNTGDYDPNERERMLIMDAIQGLLGDEDILDKIFEAREFTQAYRRNAGDCERCGCKLPDHWGNCSALQRLREPGT